MSRNLFRLLMIAAAVGILQSQAGAVEPAPVSEAPEPGARTREAILNHRYPRLVVVIAIDQLRYDLLTRFSDLFLPAFDAQGNVGGFRLLMERGAFFADAHYNHLPAHTGPGHATIMTGASPADTGIISNDWPTSSGAGMNCVADIDCETIGKTLGPRSKKGSASPKNLQAETVGDVLRFANNRQSKVVGMAVKDRGAILMTGKNPTAAVWFDSDSGNWVTSTYYTSGTLPSFAERANRERIADQWVGQEWDYFFPQEHYRRSSPENVTGMADGYGLGGTFPKALSEPGAKPDSKYWRRMITSPFGNEMVLETARMAVEAEGLGEDDFPDILTLSFSTNDIIGHNYGPNSPEVQDATIRTDRALSGFFNDLRTSRTAGLSDVLFVLTADHGVAPLPEWAAESMNYDSRRGLYHSLTPLAEEALNERFPGYTTTGLITSISEPYVYFNGPQMAARGVDMVAAQEAVAARLRGAPGVKAVYTRRQIELGQLPDTPRSKLIYNSFHPQRSGDVFILADPFTYPGRSATGATHGSSYNYDLQIPLLIAGPTIRPGFYTQRVDIRDIAPTLSTILGIQQPASSTGRVLSEILN